MNRFAVLALLFIAATLSAATAAETAKTTTDQPPQSKKTRKRLNFDNLPGNLPVVDLPRPWGDTFLPKSAPPARRLLVIDVSRLSGDERIALTCLQGLTSRKQPCLWLVRNAQDQFWLDWHQQKHHIDGYELIADWTTLFARYREVCKGAVVPDAKLYRGDLLAVNVAACEDMIVATPELAGRLNLPIRIDLRGRFATYADGLRWLWTSYKDRLSRHLCNFKHPRLLRTCTFAHDFQWRGLMFWIAGMIDASEPGADPAAEQRVVAEILSEMATNTAVLGFPFAGKGVGVGEPPGVALISRYGKGLVCTDHLANACVTSGVRIDHFEQPQQAPAPPLEKDKIYIALVMSDGDNENCWMGFFRKYFEHPSFGTFPLAFGMGPPIQELLPAVTQWYFEHAKPTTEFIADVSGVAYIQPDRFAEAYADRDRVYAGYVDWTEKLMRRLDMRSLRTVGGGDESITRFARGLPWCHSIFADMGRYSGREGIENLTYALPDGMPVFRSVTSWRFGKEGFLKEIREQVGNKRPSFVNGFVHCWTFGPEELARIYDQRDADMVFVTPSQLATLYRQAHEKSWAK